LVKPILIPVQLTWPLLSSHWQVDGYWSSFECYLVSFCESGKANANPESFSDIDDVGTFLVHLLNILFRLIVAVFEPGSVDICY
jgi:hypothetical protein